MRYGHTEESFAVIERPTIDQEGEIGWGMDLGKPFLDTGQQYRIGGTA